MRGLTTRAALRDASLATAGVVAAIFAGSGAFAHVDPALVGYLGATIVATFGVVFRLSAFWRRPPSAMYVRAALAALREPRRLAGVLHGAADDLVVQRFIARRGRLRWLAHLLLSLGTLASFAITLPLVWGWLRFEAIGQDTYVPRLAGLAVGRFAVDGAIAWGIFHGLDLAGVAVTLGALYFLVLRIRTRRSPGETSAFHVGPLLLLLAVALSGAALPVARGMPALFDVAAVVHEALVVGLLVSLPFSKLGHVLVRPLQVGVRVLHAPGPPPRALRSLWRRVRPRGPARRGRGAARRSRVSLRGAPGDLSCVPASGPRRGAGDAPRGGVPPAHRRGAPRSGRRAHREGGVAWRGSRARLRS